MRTSNVELLAEIDTLEEIKRVNANVLEVVKRIEKLEKALEDLINVAEQCDGWESFPSSSIDKACEALK